MENTIEIIRRLNILKRATELDIFTIQNIDITDSLEHLSDLAVRYIKKVTPHFQFPIKPDIISPLYSEILYRDRNNWCYYEVIENKELKKDMIITIVDSESQVIDLIINM